ncbi:hypothetical protein RchiOBHm_Chr2g0148071 [Rosa chinensis]|uniref:Uncharacterized protein n=1 Tax=Rosa chinensis TaxID=74649 RepID=A0A2P6RZB5_ROSCH|nr:hypothetical protein RchiOBHm_Chr2g0148071 [Rosa chinensis]
MQHLRLAIQLEKQRKKISNDWFGSRGSDTGVTIQTYQVSNVDKNLLQVSL